VTWWEVVVDAAIAFSVGLGVGFVLANRFRLTRRNGGG
jgi:hypothetical protein